MKVSGGGDDISNGASLPEDIINDILTLLPVKSLLRFRCVCKSWCNLFKTPRFAKLQLDYSLKNRNNGIIIDSYKKMCYLDYDALPSGSSTSSSSTLYNKLVHIAYPLEHQKQEIIGSCNGMICYRSTKDDIIILNPFTKVYKKVPAKPQQYGGVCSHGFGYDLNTEDHKLALYFSGLSRSIHVYSLELNSWKTIWNIPFKYIPCKEELVFFNGFFHWLGYCPKGISCLDVANESVKHIPLPPNMWHRATKVCVMGGCLCLITKSISHLLWMMTEYGVAESWIKVLTNNGGKISGLQYLDLQQSFKNDAILVLHRDISTYLYDLNHEVARELEIDGILPGLQTWAFGGSLVSPNS